MRLAIMCLLAVFSVSVTAQNAAVTFHDLSGMTTWPLGNMRVKGAMGQSGSFAVAEMPPGARGRAGNAHFHTQEQIVLGLQGSSVMGIGGVTYRLGVYGAVVTPPNTEHFNMNGLTTAPSTFIEFQPVIRRDWFPPHSAYAAPKSAASVPVPADRRVFEDLDLSSGGWQSDASGARSKILSGDTVRLRMWDLSAVNASAVLNPQGGRPEQFVYVVEGEVQITVDSKPTMMASQTLAVVSQAAKDVRLRSLGKGRALVSVFEGTSLPTQ